MRVLTAGAGSRPEDFAHTIPGEIVYIGTICAADLPEQGGNGRCGCGRAFSGVASGKATTVAVVADLELTMDDLAAMLTDRFTRSGWKDPAEMGQGFAEEIVEEAETFPEGTRLRRDIDDVSPE